MTVGATAVALAASDGSSAAAAWVSGLATAVAVGVAVWALLNERRRHRDEVAELRDARSEERERWLAERADRAEAEQRAAVSGVVAYIAPDYASVQNPGRPDKPQRMQTGWSLIVRNGSLDPLLKWHALVERSDSSGVVTELCWRDKGLIPPASPGSPDERFDLSEALPPQPMALRTTLLFQDVSGRHWKRGDGPIELLGTAPNYDCANHVGADVEGRL